VLTRTVRRADERHDQRSKCLRRQPLYVAGIRVIDERDGGLVESEIIVSFQELTCAAQGLMGFCIELQITYACMCTNPRLENGIRILDICR
jgi:hypothetical protein